MEKNIYFIYTVSVSISNLSTVMDRRQLRTVFSKDFGVNKLQSVFSYGMDVGSFKHETNSRFSYPNNNHYSIYASKFFL